LANLSDDRDDKVFEQLQRVTVLLEDLFILHGCQMGMNKEALRSILAIDKKRIGRIGKHIKKA
jgi:hypothetical protein